MSSGQSQAPLPYTDERHQAAAQFLTEEAHLLDTSDFEAWLGLMDRRIRYRMPVRVTAVKAADEVDVQTMHHFDEKRCAATSRLSEMASDLPHYSAVIASDLRVCH